MKYSLRSISLTALCISAGMYAANHNEIDFSRIRTWIGEGQNESAVILSWNDNQGIDKLIVGLRHDASPAKQDIITALIKNDRRFYAPEGASAGSLCFDNGGEGKLSDPAYTIYDHQGIEGDKGQWNIETSTVDGKNIFYLTYDPGYEFISKYDTTPFYLPEESTIGAWFAENTEIVLSDISPIIPIYYNAGEGNSTANITVTLTAAEKKIASSISYAESSALLGLGDSRMKVTLATFKDGDEIIAHCGSLVPKVSLRYKKGSASSATVAPATSEGTITVNEPAPLLGIAFSEDNIRAKISEKYPLELISTNDSGPYSGGFSLSYENLEEEGGIAQGYLSPDRNNSRKFTASFNKQGTGKMRVTAKSKAYPEVSAQCVIDIYAEKLLTKVSLGNIAGSELHLNAYTAEEYMYNSHPIHVVVEPEDADLPTLKLRTSLDKSENGPLVTASYMKQDKSYDLTTKAFGTPLPANEIYTATKERKWESVLESNAELEKYTEPVSMTAWFDSMDGSGIKSEEFTITIDPRDRNPEADNYQDGTFWLNEDWFGHTNSSINYITADKDIKYRVYESQNPGHSFGCTAQYGMVYGDRLYVMSKQQADNGDRYRVGGGRLVIADAKTLKRITSFDEIGTTAGTTGAGPNGSTMAGDGRACVGVRPDKIYIGHHKGIRVLNIDLANAASSDPAVAASAFTLGDEIKVSGDNKGLYEGQTGDMVCVGKYVFAVTQSNGLIVIDTDTDEIIKTLGTNLSTDSDKEEYSVQGVLISSDGNVWYAETDNSDTSNRKTYFVMVNPSTLEECGRHLLPAGAGTVNTGWGAWRSANFFASKKKNVIYWGNVGSGYKDDILGSGTGNIYRWEIGTPLPEKPFFSLGKRPGMNETTFQSPYATMRYDDRTDEIWMCTTHGASYNYRYEWIYAIDGTTAEENFYTQLKPYFWFPAIPIFPDKYAPRFNDLDGIKISTEPLSINLRDFVEDEDGINPIINIDIVNENTRASVSPFSYSFENDILTLTPQSTGNGELTLIAEHNGKTTRHTLPVNVDLSSGINEIGQISSMNVKGNTLFTVGLSGKNVTVYDLNGNIIREYTPSADNETLILDIPAGVYIIRTADIGLAIKAIIK